MVQHFGRARTVLTVAALAVALSTAACGGGDKSPTAASAPTSRSTPTSYTARTTVALSQSGPVPTAASCPTSAEMQSVFKQAPSSSATPRSTSSGVSCDYKWDPDPGALVTVRGNRFDSAATIEQLFASNLKRDQDVAAGRNHSAEPGTITSVQGVGDQAYVQMEQPPAGEQRPPDYTLNARAGTLLLLVHVQDYSGTRFGPNSGNPALAVEIAKLFLKKVG
jgi:hypothetical protein